MFILFVTVKNKIIQIKTTYFYDCLGNTLAGGLSLVKQGMWFDLSISLS